MRQRARNAGLSALPLTPLADFLVRLGFMAKGIVTMMVGAVALRYALGAGSELEDQRGAIESLRDEPNGRIILGLLAAGLSGYALWMFTEAIADPERKGTSFAGLAERVGFFVTGVAYALLAQAAVNLLLGRNAVGMAPDDLVAMLLTPRLGRWLVGLVGVIVMIAGVLQLRLGVTRHFLDVLYPDVSRPLRILATISGGIGYMTLGTLSLLVGYSILEVAIKYDPREARGWEETLSLISSLGHGPWLLGAASVGLMLYGLYFVLLARYRRL